MLEAHTVEICLLAPPPPVSLGSVDSPVNLLCLCSTPQRYSETHGGSVCGRWVFKGPDRVPRSMRSNPPAERNRVKESQNWNIREASNASLRRTTQTNTAVVFVDLRRQGSVLSHDSSDVGVSLNVSLNDHWKIIEINWNEKKILSLWPQTPVVVFSVFIKTFLIWLKLKLDKLTNKEKKVNVMCCEGSFCSRAVCSRSVSGEVEQEEPAPARFKSRWRRTDLGQKSERLVSTQHIWNPWAVCVSVCQRVCYLSIDSREQKPNTAAEYLAAHLSKIHGLDWHPDNEFILATSSQDNSVRVRRCHVIHSVSREMMKHFFSVCVYFFCFCSCFVCVFSFGITDSPGSTWTSCRVRCRCGRPGTRWVGNTWDEDEGNKHWGLTSQEQKQSWGKISVFRHEFSKIVSGHFRVFVFLLWRSSRRSSVTC